MSAEAFLADEIRQAATLHYLAVIGEAIAQLSPELRAKYPHIPWQQIISVRHRIVHAYFDLDWRILWVAASEDVPEPGRQAAESLGTEFPDLRSAS